MGEFSDLTVLLFFPTIYSKLAINWWMNSMSGNFVRWFLCIDEWTLNCSAIVEWKTRFFSHSPKLIAFAIYCNENGFLATPVPIINHILFTNLKLITPKKNSAKNFYFLIFFSSLFWFFTVPRENDGSQFGRHINLQLTYSFQQNTTHNLQQMNNNNNSSTNNNNNTTLNNNNITSKTGLFTPHGKWKITPPTQYNPTQKFSLKRIVFFAFTESSLDELSEDSAIHCLQNEV